MITQASLRQKGEERALKILLAEDNVVNQKLAMRMLERRDHQVTVVANGREALQALEQDAFDLVLMDMQMPEMDGFEATACLREREVSTGRRQPVIAMTALAMNGDRERCLAAGMDGYLSKPIRPQELDEVLDLYSSKKTAHPVAEAVYEPVSSIDCTQLLSRIDNDRAFLAELLDLFRRDYPTHLESAQKAIDMRSPVSLQSSAHALKGALGNLAAVEGYALAAELEEMGRTLDLTSAQVVLDRLATELQNVIHALEALCPAAAQ